MNSVTQAYVFVVNLLCHGEVNLLPLHTPLTYVHCSRSQRLSFSVVRDPIVCVTVRKVYHQTLSNFMKTQFAKVGPTKLFAMFA